MRTVVIRFWDENFCWTIQVAVIGLTQIFEFLFGNNAMLFKHHHQHFRVHDWAGVEEFHKDN